jgi:hypothetical protein
VAEAVVLVAVVPAIGGAVPSAELVASEVAATTRSPADVAATTRSPAEMLATTPAAAVVLVAVVPAIGAAVPTAELVASEVVSAPVAVDGAFVVHFAVAEFVVNQALQPTDQRCHPCPHSRPDA